MNIYRVQIKYKGNTKMNSRKSKLCISVVIMLIIMVICIIDFNPQHGEPLLNQDSVNNEVFTEDFFEGLMEVQSVPTSVKTSDSEKLKQMCSILANTSLKESRCESNYYGGYYYELKFEHGKEKTLSFIGVSEDQTYIYVDEQCYETDEKILPQIINLIGY